MLNGFWLGDIYIVDYPELIMPPYDAEKAKEITESGRKYMEELRNFRKENNIKLIANDKEF